MCGLAGILSYKQSSEEREATVRRMAAVLVHRGPDGEGYVTRGACSLGFRRLAIMDVAAPSPPFANEDRTLWSVANAEIYNARELHADLVARGHALRTHVDTEVIPHLYEEAGVDLARRLDGMFAFALWDEQRQVLLLARDRAGEKPLFYWQGDGEIVFASELRALLVHPRIGKAVDAVALHRYLLHGFFPAPFSPLAGIRKLPAGHFLVARPEGVEVRRYWDLAEHYAEPELARRRPADLAAELDARIAQAIEGRRRCDVPLGIFLSGGIDSTVLLAHATAQSGAGVPVFTIGHSDPDFDESSVARESARFFHADLHTLVLSETDLAEGLRRVGEGLDEPLGDASTIPCHLLSLFARQHVKVVLSGEGSDELFAGYPTYPGHRLSSGYRRLPGFLRRGLLIAAQHRPASTGNVDLGFLLRRFTSGAEQGLLERHLLWFGSLGQALQEEVAAPRLLDLWRGDDPLGSGRSRLAGRKWPDELTQALYLDFTLYLPDDLLVKIDRTTMLASLEARAPFLDHKLDEFAAGLPSRCKLSGLTTKALLRQAERGRVPDHVLTRRKRGFNIPLSRWLLNGLGVELRQRFSKERVAARGLLSPAGVAHVLDDHLARRADHGKPLFNLLALDLWCDKVFGEGMPVPVA